MKRRSSSDSPSMLPSLLGAMVLHGFVVVAVTSGADPTPVTRASLVPTISVDVAWPEEPPVVPEARAEADGAQDAPSEGRPPRAFRVAPKTPALPSETPSELVSSSESEQTLTTSDEEPSSRLGFGDASGGRGAGRGEGAGAVGASGDSFGTSATAEPRLVPGSARCADLFPYDARSERGLVTVTVFVDATGRGSFREVSDASPQDQGFEEAARFCAERLRFLPGRDEHGDSVSSTTRVRLTFQRTS